MLTHEWVMIPSLHVRCRWCFAPRTEKNEDEQCSHREAAEKLEAARNIDWLAGYPDDPKV